MLSLRTSCRLGLVVLVLATAACASDDEAPDAVEGDSLSGLDGAPDAAGPLTLTEYLKGFVETICAEQARCQSTSASATCVGEAWAPYVAATLPTLEAAIAAGELVYDGSKATACLASMIDPTCSFANWSPLADSAACLGLFVGQVAEGGACRDHRVCAGAPDTYCDTSAACPGACATRLSLGEPCEHGNVCIAGLTCGDGGCKAVTSAAHGEACDRENGPACAGLLQCAPVGDSEDRICQTNAEIATVPLGEPCWPYQRNCLPGLACRYREGAGPLCVEMAGAGEPCGTAVPSMCPALHECSGTAPEAFTCVPWPSVGEPCREGCQPPAACTGETCTIGLENGAPCERETECLSGACTHGVCTARDLCANDK